MSWNNYGKNGWEIDHIIPCSYFDLTKEENQRICFNYRNLQPLWASENNTKKAKVPDNVEELVEFFKTRNIWIIFQLQLFLQIFI